MQEITEKYFMQDDNKKSLFFEIVIKITYICTGNEIS